MAVHAVAALALPSVEAFDLAIPAQVFGDRRQAGQYSFTVCAPTPGLAARYPMVKVDPDVLWIDEGSVLTSAGLAAGIDLCVQLAARIREARRLLEVTDLPVDDVAARSGLGSATNLRLHLARDAGTTPTAYRATYQGRTLRS